MRDRSLVVTTLLAGLVGSCFGCVGTMAARTVPEPPPATQVTRDMARAVGIIAVCQDPDTGLLGVYGGTGVVVSSTQVVTAAHVVDCPGGAFRVVQDGIARQVTVEAVNEGVDLARLVLHEDAQPLRFLHFVLGRPPAEGSVVCIAHVEPWKGHTCGRVQAYSDPERGDLVHDAITEPGNSGSGLYDSDGRLVGIVVRYWACANGQICGGRAVTLWERSAILP